MKRWTIKHHSTKRLVCYADSEDEAIQDCGRLLARNPGAQLDVRSPDGETGFTVFSSEGEMVFETEAM